MSAPPTFKIDHYTGLYDNVSVLTQVGAIVVAGFVTYLLERLVAHEAIVLGTLLFFLKIGAAVNFRGLALDCIPAPMEGCYGYALEAGQRMAVNLGTAQRIALIVIWRTAWSGFTLWGVHGSSASLHG